MNRLINVRSWRITRIWTDKLRTGNAYPYPLIRFRLKMNSLLFCSVCCVPALASMRIPIQFFYLDADPDQVYSLLYGSGSRKPNQCSSIRILVRLCCQKSLIFT
jgi:hypothetical protein